MDADGDHSGTGRLVGVIMEDFELGKGQYVRRGHLYAHVASAAVDGNRFKVNRGSANVYRPDTGIRPSRGQVGRAKGRVRHEQYVIVQGVQSIGAGISHDVVNVVNGPQVDFQERRELTLRLRDRLIGKRSVGIAIHSTRRVATKGNR